MNKTNSNKIIFAVAIISLLAICLGIYFYSTIYNSTVTGYSSITKKEYQIPRVGIATIDYYIYVDVDNNVTKLQCTKQEYENVIIDKNLAYGISYKWSTLFPNKGKLLYVNFSDIIDNR